MTLPMAHTYDQTTPVIGMIWAQARGGVIGANNAIPWHYSDDMKHFRRTTAGHAVIMGRETWESLPIRPLPKRTNIVLSTQHNYEAPGAIVVASVPQALQWLTEHPRELPDNDASAAHPTPTAWIIGGATIYQAFMPYASHLEVTDIHRDIAGDTVAPPIPSTFHCEKRSTLCAPDGTELTFSTWRTQSTTSPGQPTTDETR
ncbi:dihydrofolate reductase [Jonesia quinghaiensis]|uniref:dihydrofolate reductase n=1 Tax=Jonesia quinghaiensis TaxID=262806 RepID=UPI000426E936|nr:dihydrofolate reductase [Jonesia quinghaiensis]